MLRERVILAPGTRAPDPLRRVEFLVWLAGHESQRKPPPCPLHARNQHVNRGPIMLAFGWLEPAPRCPVVGMVQPRKTGQRFLFGQSAIFRPRGAPGALVTIQMPIPPLVRIPKHPVGVVVVTQIPR
jgi:hypothetical protein